MKTTELFKFNRSSKRINESLEKVFGKKINFEEFDTMKLEDARNKLRTQISQVRSQSGFNETIENDALTQAQWMHDAIVAELMNRQEHIVDSTQQEEIGYDEVSPKDASYILRKIESGVPMSEIVDDFPELSRMMEVIAGERGLHPDDDFEEIEEILMNDLEDIAAEGDDFGDEGGDTDDDYALASAGHGSDEDYGDYGSDDYEEQIDFEDITMEKAPPGDKYERMVKHIKKGYAKDGKLSDKERSIAYATAWKAKNKANESIETGEDMTKLTEGEIQQASAIVTAKTMVDRVGRWIEELSGMENDTLLQLGDSIRDEMGSEQAKNFISAVAPAIQQALENLKTTRETLSTGVRQLTGEEQAASMLGAEPGAEPAMGGEEEVGAAEPDMMNTGAEAGDEFAAAEPAAGGMETAGREQRESIERQNRLLKVLAG